MSISVQCRKCAQRYRVNEGSAGRSIRCQKCGATVEIPLPGAPDDRMPPVPGAAGPPPSGSDASPGSSSVLGGSSNKTGSSTIELSNSSVFGALSSMAGGASPSNSSVLGANPSMPPGKSSVAAGKSSVTPAAPTTSPAMPAKSPDMPPGESSGPPKLPRAAAPAIPVAQPAAGVGAPYAAPIAAPFERSANPSVGARAQAAQSPHLDFVRAGTVEEMLDEEERQGRVRFRGLRRLLKNPPSIEEMGQFLASHKIFTAIIVIATFVEVEYLRSGQGLLALVFGVFAIGLSYMGLHPRLSEGALYQASAWCYLIVLCAFPILSRYKVELGLAGAKVMRNPTQVAATQAPVPQTVPSAPAPGTADDADQPATDAQVPAVAVEAPTVPQPMPPTAPATPSPEASVPAESPTAEPPPESPPAATPSAPVTPEDFAPVPNPQDGSTELPANATLRLEDLRQRADRAFAEADPNSALRYLYADALAHTDSDVWGFYRWSRILRRAVIAVRLGAGVELDDLASEATGIVIGRHAAQRKAGNAFQGELASAFDRQTGTAGGRTMITWLHAGYDEGKFGDLELIRAPTERALRGSTYLGADTPAETLREARLQSLDLLLLFSLRGVPNPTGRPTFATVVRAVDMSTGRELYASKARTSVAQVRKEVDTLLETLNKETQLEDLPAELDVAAIQARVKAQAGRKKDNPLPMLAELVYYQREKRLPQDTVDQLLASLIGDDDAKVMSGGSDLERGRLVLKWLRKQGP